MHKHTTFSIPLWIVLAVPLITSCTSTDDQEDQDVVDELAESLGGRHSLLRFANFRYTATGSTTIGDEGLAPGDRLATGDYERTISFDAEREAIRIDHSATLHFELLDGSPQAFTEVVVGNKGAITAGESVLGTPAHSLSSDRVASTWRRAELLNPLLLILRAKPGTIRRGPTIEINGKPHHTFILDQGITDLTFVISRRGQLVQVRTQESHRLHRDVSLIVEYSNWQRLPNSPLRAPMAVRMTVNNVVVLEETRSNANGRPDFSDDTFELDIDVDDTPFSQQDYDLGRLGHHWNQAWSAVGIPLEGIVRTMNSQPLADGIFLLTGGVHNTLVIEQEDEIVVVDGPIGPEQGEGITEFIANTFPGKPISYVIPSHFHQDHAAGVRELAGAGAQVLVGSSMQDYWTELLNQPSQIIPDRQELNQGGAVLGFTGDVFELADSTRPISVLRIPDNHHASDMVLVTAQVGETRYVFIADLYGPFLGSFIVEGPQDFLRGLQQHGLIDQSCKSESPLVIVGAHGGVEPIADSLTFISNLGIDLSEICQ